MARDFEPLSFQLVYCHKAVLMVDVFRPGVRFFHCFFRLRTSTNCTWSTRYDLIGRFRGIKGRCACFFNGVATIMCNTDLDRLDVAVTPLIADFPNCRWRRHLEYKHAENKPRYRHPKDDGRYSSSCKNRKPPQPNKIPFPYPSTAPPERKFSR